MWHGRTFKVLPACFRELHCTVKARATLQYFELDLHNIDGHSVSHKASLLSMVSPRYGQYLVPCKLVISSWPSPRPGSCFCFHNTDKTRPNLSHSSPCISLSSAIQCISEIFYGSLWSLICLGRTSSFHMMLPSISSSRTCLSFFLRPLNSAIIPASRMRWSREYSGWVWTQCCRSLGDVTKKACITAHTEKEISQTKLFPPKAGCVFQNYAEWVSSSASWPGLYLVWEGA